MFNFFVFHKFTPLVTTRLYLREFALGDGVQLYQNLRGPEAAARADVDAMETVPHAEAAVHRYIENFKNRQSIRWAITLKLTNKIIGMCSIQDIDAFHRRGEISYEIASDYWRDGYATEAVAAMIDFSFGTVNFHRLEAVTEPKNTASQGLLEKLGFQYEGTLRKRFLRAGEYCDDMYFGLLKSEWADESS